MKKKTLFGSLIAGVMLVLVSIAPSINANVESLFTETPQVEKATPISLVLQLMAKLRNHKDIQNVETGEEVLQIIEEDEELNSVYEQLFVEDCGCGDDSSELEWKFPTICMILYIPLTFIIIIAIASNLTFGLALLSIFEMIGTPLNCFWLGLIP